MGISRRNAALVTTIGLLFSALAPVVSPLSPSAGASAAGASAAGASAAPARAVKPCAALRTQTGVTASTITVANVADITGPVPGLHAGEQRAVEAFAAYADAKGIRICGRKLVVKAYDARTDTSGDLQAYDTACATSFAAVGSASDYDKGGAGVAQGCGLPDIRVSTQSRERVACSTCFAVRPSGIRPSGSVVFATSVPDALVAAYPEESQRTATLYLDVANSRALPEVRAWTKRGMEFPYVQSISTTEFNYSSYVSAMKSRNIAIVRFIGPTASATKLVQAMQQQGYAPTATILDTQAYGPDYLRQGGAAAEAAHTLVLTDALPFEEASRNADLRLYRTWLERTRPGTAPTVDGLYAWSAMRLFVTQAKALKGGLTRASLVGRLRTVKGWSDDAMHAPQPVGAKRVSRCWRLLRPSRGRWVAAGSSAYRCGGIVSAD